VKPLDRLTVLDLSRVLACPFASMILAELGARVIKVEQPGSGDETRGFEPRLEKDSAYYFACNRLQGIDHRRSALRRWEKDSEEARRARRRGDRELSGGHAGAIRAGLPRAFIAE